MSRLSWYWHRLRAMSPAEIALHARKKLRQRRDAARLPDWSAVKLASSGAFPKLPDPAVAPEILRQALARDVQNILAGRWKAFGHLDLQVDDPPRWHCDYLAGKDLATTQCAFDLNHRDLPDGADIKLIWELSRWHPLTRLAMAAHVLGDARALAKCLECLVDWVEHNPPYRGWNWTSALESGMRLIQFTWIDALLARTPVLYAESTLRGSLGSPSPPGEGDTSSSLGTVRRLSSSNAGSDELTLFGREVWSEDELNDRIRDGLQRLRREILPAHVWFTWRHQSFGSSANNHLLGELTGLILATTRWPELAQWGASLDELQRRWEREVLAQFAGDGGNREQALNYQLFSWELCWQARAALVALGRTVSSQVAERLRLAARFFVEIQVPGDPWDYGDSDNAFVTPLFVDERRSVEEWHRWFQAPEQSAGLDYWWGGARREMKLGIGENPSATNEWRHSVESGHAMRREGDWTLRWDLSPLGYLATAAHGHLDALHLSVWFKGVALIIDPGTGAYYANKELRTWLASRPAHNGPSPVSAESWPRRLGPFLWAENHNAPVYDDDDKDALWAVMRFPNSAIQRAVGLVDEGKVVEVRDSVAAGQPGEFVVRWQFAPGAILKRRGERDFILHRQGIEMTIQVSEDWAEVNLVETAEDRNRIEPENPLAGIVSPAFRKTVWAPYLKLVAWPEGRPCVFRTTFLASPGA